MPSKAFLLFTFIAASILTLVHCQQDTSKSHPKTTFLNLQDSVAYMGIQTCQSCHRDVYDSFRHTGMGQSFDVASPQKSQANFGKHALVYDKKSDFHYRPFFKDSILYITEFRIENGDTTHQRTEKISYIVGSGQHTNSHILDFNGYIFQAPITYYTQEEKWDMAPGFEHDNLRFSRLLTSECITCHNHLPKQVQGSMNKFIEMPQGIECERCHGPGEIHVRKMLAGEQVDTATSIDYSIVNPRHLERDLQMDLCQRCHLQGVAVTEEGKTFYDFKPGMKLSEIMNVFLPRYSNSHEKFIMASQADRLRQSPCYLESEDLSCITCHNPHQSVTSVNKEHFNIKCQSCHQEKTCSELEPIRLAANNNCVSCHMPPSGSIDIPHVNITDHYISKETANRHKNISLEEKESIAQFLGLEILTKDNPSHLEMARGYIALFDKYTPHVQMLDSAYWHLEQCKLPLEQQFKTRVHYFFAKENYKAISELATKKDAASLPDAWTAYRIGEAFFQEKKYSKALLFYKKSVELLPYHLDFQEKLGVNYVQLNYMQEAEKVFEKVLSENEKRPLALTNLGYIKARQKKYVESLELYNKAISLDPDYEQALLNKAAILIYQKKNQAAKKYLERVLKINPENSQAKVQIESL